MGRWDQFGERVKARLRPDGSKSAALHARHGPGAVHTSNHRPRDPQKEGQASERVKIATGGTEKERATSTPLLPGDGVLGNKWGTIIPRAKPKPGKRLAKNTVAKSTGLETPSLPSGVRLLVQQDGILQGGECVMMIRLIKNNYDTRDSPHRRRLQVAQVELFIGGMAQINCTVVPVDAG